VSPATREGTEPVCPFCRAALKRPEAVALDDAESALGGACGACGAIYLVDPTGKNVGELMMQAFGLVAKKLSKDISELVAGEDYEDAVLNYDFRTHRSSGISRGFMDRSGRIYIVKVKQKPE
jgi:hypothetical protein